jgi:16S rRNA (cytosine967-C5)-methyltransferase
VSVSRHPKNKRVRELASEILVKTETKKAYADLLLDQTIRNSVLSERDRALLTEITLGTLRWRATIDAHLSRHLRRPLADTDPFLRNVLRVTLYQLLFLDKIPEYAAVNEAVELAKARGGRREGDFVNGVLRNFLRSNPHALQLSPAGDNSVSTVALKYSHPDWLVRRWIEQFGVQDGSALMQANNEKPPLVVRANQHRSSREAVLARLYQDGVAAEATLHSPQGIVITSGGVVAQIPAFREGLLQPQSEASQLVVYLLAPRPGERILDACAAPGGKATHIAEMMGDSGDVIAADKSAKGIEKIRENGTRLKLRSLHTVRADLTREVPNPYRVPYDRILVDAPCSGFGTLRSHPEIKWRRNEMDISRLSRLQATILNRVAPSVKAGGIVVYSTCTLMPEENEQVVRNFLLAHSEFELEDAVNYLPPNAKSMVHERYFLALPHRDNTDGFFAARMRKVA